MKKTVRSLGHSLTGLRHALTQEANLRRFALGQIVVLLAAIAVGMSIVMVVVILVFAAAFIVVELLNTAIERLADTFDDCEKQRNSGHFHPGVKMTKDVAAAASLVALVAYGAVLLLAFLPYLLFLVIQPR